jgi:hypothetical protein
MWGGEHRGVRINSVATSVPPEVPPSYLDVCHL